MPTQITQIIPCENWFHITVGQQGEDVCNRVVAWGLLDDGSVVGLVPERRVGGRSEEFDRLTPIPRSREPGDYVHLNELSDEQMAQLDIPNTQP